MQIRLTVLGSRSGHQTASAPASCDVLVTAPVGTVLAAVASGLAATVGGPDTGGTVVLYAGAERLDLQRRVLGEPPLVDGAVLALNAPVPDVLPEEGLGAPQLHVVAGPDAGGVHLLHSGQIRVGRSADADVPLDDPDVSRLHCAVTVLRDGRVAVADLDSTNGTTLDGAPVGPQPVALAPGALLRVGESTLRLAPSGAAAPRPTTPDLEGHLSVPPTGPNAYGAAASTGSGGSGTGTPGAARWAGSGGAPTGPHASAPQGAPGTDDTGPAGWSGPAGTGGTPTGSGGPGGTPHGTSGAAGSGGSGTGTPGAARWAGSGGAPTGPHASAPQGAPGT
ncbi:FHA domain-containing protein, partial [Streptomyces sp. NPDC059874]|uniref:FHA domain-containing protein n=1 Tax=Streptomyces sp. NPDC059874 TaxID=3346983 RepID=UPI00366803EF